VSIVLGPDINEGTVVDHYYLVRPSSVGGFGASLNAATPNETARGFKAVQMDELVGKIGPVVGIYDPEGASRMVQDW